MRRFGTSLFLLAVLICVAPLAQAQTENVEAGVPDALQANANGFVQSLGKQAVAIVAKASTQQQRDAQFHDLLVKSFDLQTIGHFVMGRSWNAATPDQQQKYMHLFEGLIVKTYGDRLSLYTGENFHAKDARAESERDIIVNSEITHPDGSAPTTIDWRLRLKDQQLKVIDVVVEGVSLSVTQRQEYASVIQQSGIDGLLALMQKRLDGA
jgi:phospholipid transport system substrate-binding protein